MKCMFRHQDLQIFCAQIKQIWVSSATWSCSGTQLQVGENLNKLTCVSLTRSTTWKWVKVQRFKKMEVNDFAIMLIDVTFILNMFKSWYLMCQYTLFNNNMSYSEQRWTVLIRQLLHTFQWQHATQWATPNCFNQTTVNAQTRAISL